MRLRLHLALALITACLARCSCEVPNVNYPYTCEAEGDCALGFTCFKNVCAETASLDASVPFDAGAGDAAVPDAGAADGGVDAGTNDAGTNDAGTNDAGTGLLTVVAENTPTSVNLTTEGTTDWAKWGRVNASSFDHKLLTSSLIPDYQRVGDAGTISQFSTLSVSYSWSDGTPTASATTNTGLAFLSGAAYSLTLPAGTAPQTLRLYGAPYFSGIRLEAFLSDNSAAPVTDTSRANAAGSLNTRFTITYRALSNGQTLTVRMTRIFISSTGDINLQAATLAPGP